MRLAFGPYIAAPGETVDDADDREEESGREESEGARSAYELPLGRRRIAAAGAVVGGPVRRRRPWRGRHRRIGQPIDSEPPPKLVRLGRVRIEALRSGRMKRVGVRILRVIDGRHRSRDWRRGFGQLGSVLVRNGSPGRRLERAVVPRYTPVLGVLPDHQCDQLRSPNRAVGRRLLTEHEPVFARLICLAALNGRSKLELAEPVDRMDRG